MDSYSQQNKLNKDSQDNRSFPTNTPHTTSFTTTISEAGSAPNSPITSVNVSPASSIGGRRAPPPRSSSLRSNPASPSVEPIISLLLSGDIKTVTEETTLELQQSSETSNQIHGGNTKAQVPHESSKPLNSSQSAQGLTNEPTVDSFQQDGPTDSDQLVVLTTLQKTLNDGDSEAASETTNSEIFKVDVASEYGDNEPAGVNLKRRITLGRNWKMSNHYKPPTKPLTRTASISSARGKRTASSLNSSETATQELNESDGSIPIAIKDLKVTPDLNKAAVSAKSKSTPPLVELNESKVTPDNRSTNSALPANSQISPEKRKKYVEVRKYILGELLMTEKNYVDNLETVLKQFKAPLVKAANGHNSSSASLSFGHESNTNLHRNASINRTSIIPMVDIKLIFAFIDELWDFNKSFAKDLQRVVEGWELSEKIWESMSKKEVHPDPSAQPLSLGELFMRHTTEFGIYLKFVDNYAAAKEAIRRSEENSPAYRHFIADCLKSKECQRQGINDFLILPVQRVTRYVLLLQDLKKHTPPDHPDFENIVKALEEMRKLANTVNEVKRREEEMTRMFHVVRTVEDCPPTLISAQRRILFETDGIDVTRDYPHLALHPIAISNSGISIVPTSTPIALPSSNDGFVSIVRIFVFSDIVMLAKPKAKKKKEKSLFSTLTGNDLLSKKEKLSLFRLSWLKDIELIDVEDDKIITSHARGHRQKHLVKIVLHNSDGQSSSARKKFWTELAMNSNLTGSVRTKIQSTSPALTAETFQDPSKSQKSNEGKNSTKDSKEESKFTLESIEELAIARLRKAEEQEKMSKPLLQRASTILSRSPMPRSTSLITTNPNIASMLEQMTFDTTGSSLEHGVITKTPSAIPGKLGTSVSGKNSGDLLSGSPAVNSTSLISIDSYLSSLTNLDGNIEPAIKHEVAVLKDSPSKGSSESIASTSKSSRSTTLPHSPSSNLGSLSTETFVFEFQDKKQKKEFILVLEGVLRETRLELNVN